MLSIPFSVYSQKSRIVTDNDKKFNYTDSTGVTGSYISFFGDSFNIPDLKKIDGKIINNGDTKGKTVFYNFWFVACKPCVAEIPVLNKLAEKYRSDSTLFIAISFDKEDRIQEFLKKRPFNFLIASLSQAEIDHIKKISFYPFTAIVTKDGKLSFALFGRPMRKNNEEELFNLLDEQLKNALSL